MILALLLTSLEGMIRRDLLDTERLPCQEAIINVASQKELEAQLGPNLMQLGQMPKGFAVAESTDVSRTDQPPILVVYADGFWKPWRPDENALSDIHLLFAEVLRVLVAHLLGKSIEPDVLFPKIGGLVRRIGYRSS